MTPEELHAYAAASATFLLRCDTAFCPDVGPSTPQGPVEFYLHVDRAGVTWYSWESRIYKLLSPQDHAALIALVDPAIDDMIRDDYPDTAVGRTITFLHLDRSLRLKGAKQASRNFSHFMPPATAESAAWARLLRACAELVADVVSPGDLARWQFLLSFYAPSLLSPRLGTPMVMPVEVGSGLWSYPLSNAGIYLRVGQPPGPSELYRIARSAEGATVIPLGLDGSEGPSLATLTPSPNAVARWTDESAVHYRHPPVHSVEVLVAHGTVTVRATPEGRGVWVQRA